MINELEDFDDDESLDDEEFHPLNIDEIKKNLSNYDTKKLCEMIVCNRYFGSYKELAVICMEELAARRIAGDNFDFEDYIEKTLNSLPKLNIALPDLGDMLRQVISRKTVNK